MKKSYSKITAIILLTCLSFASCKKETQEMNAVHTTSTDKDQIGVVNLETDPRIDKLADTLAYRLSHNPSTVVGYSLTVSYKNKTWLTRTGGYARQPNIDANWQPMTSSTQYSIASVSKTISAAALIHCLNTPPNGYNMIDWPMWTYLPKHWQMGPNIKNITFRQLLTHTSGFRDTTNGPNGTAYQDLKALVAKGVSMSNQGVYTYNNRNYALLRLLIPILAKYQVTQFDPGINTQAQLASIENTQAQQFADDYKDYCHKVIFDKLTEYSYMTIDCKNSSAFPGLYYSLPGYPYMGIAVGDLTLTSGGQGWVMNSPQIADFFRTLHYTEDIVPKMLSDLMKTQLLGYDATGLTKDNISYYWKNGIYDRVYPAKLDTQGFRSIIIGFGDDVQISAFTNSPVDLVKACIAAHEDWKQ